VNYRHEFHAGNFADVVKHTVLCRILNYLRSKPAAFRVIDTHAGAGLYDLTGVEAIRGGEWHGGIEKLMAARLPDPAAALLSPYLEVVNALNEPGHLRVYPGSPALARAWLRPQDRLIACELEPKAAGNLSRNLQGDPRIKTLRIDGWTALNAYVPPKERRGLVLVDPPFTYEQVIRVGDWGGYMMLDCDDPLAVHKFCSMLPAFVFEARPVVPINDAVRVELEAIDFRDKLKRKGK